MAFTDSSGIGPLLGSAAPDYFQPVEQAPSHMDKSFSQSAPSGQTCLRHSMGHPRSDRREGPRDRTQAYFLRHGTFACPRHYTMSS